jgi:hypothetical protein
LLSAQSRHAKFRSSRVPDAGLASDISLEALLVEVARRHRDEQGLFLYLVLDRQMANLALARHNLKRIEGELAI